jgi:hypothetical protein
MSKNYLSTEQRIMKDLVDRISADPSISELLKKRIHTLWESGSLSDSDAVFKAITEGLSDDAKN